MVREVLVGLGFRERVYLVIMGCVVRLVSCFTNPLTCYSFFIISTADATSIGCIVNDHFALLLLILGGCLSTKEHYGKNAPDCCPNTTIECKFDNIERQIFMQN